MAKKQAKAELTADRLRFLLRYDANTGEFVWLRQQGSRKAGDVAGAIKTEGYREIGIDGRLYYAHRLVWLYVFGRWPTEQIDHRNGDESDNRLSNLRECSNAENCQNLGLRKSNKSGLTGVRWDAARSKWAAQIRIDGKITPLGRYQTKEMAHQAYLAAKATAHRFQPTPREATQ